MSAGKQKALIPGGLLLAAAGFSAESQAGCYFGPGTSEHRASFNMGTIIVQRDTPAGTVLAEKSWPQGSYDLVVKCTSGTWQYTEGGELKFATVSGGSYGHIVHNTNIEGVGIVIGTGTFPSSFPYSGTFIVPPSQGLWIGNAIMVRLVKISSNSVGAGAITTGTLARSYINTSPRFYYSTVTLTGGTIVRGACTVTNTSIQVPLGDTPRTDFKGVSTASKSVPFNIPLNCNANTKVKITLNGTAAPGGAKGVIALSSSSETVATGVGVQMLYKNAPVTLGTVITVGTASSGVYNIPLIGRYYQTQAKVTSGKANAMATFTMTYN